ncbi:MAG: RNA polymerase sigma-70 factor [Bacteroidales bacterium]|jgi:RNA polymerase sigma-70 factor (ECF subfamily)|nr:RNA polymerase sigma-70 factor [Bacteroidales bacterium]MCI1784661.1 RNA polymerase sigma-70 factor [Bacteroidales bacterium]
MKADTISSKEFGELFITYKEKFIAIATSYIRDRIVAEDIVSDCFTSFWDKKAEINITSVPQAYILTSVKNRCINYLRDKATEMRIRKDIQNDAYKTIMTEINIMENENMDLLFRSDIEKIFRDFMATLPKITRDIFYSSRFENLTYNEIAEKYKVTPRKVKREIQHVLALMRHSLKDYLPVILLFYPLITHK